LVFVDEFAINTAMTRTYARAPRGERATVPEPVNYGARIAVLGALSLQGLLAPRTSEGAVNREVFALYGEHCLAPALRPGDLGFLDNVQFHYSERAVSLRKAAGASVGGVSASVLARL